MDAMMTKRSIPQKGFTIVELLIVVVVIGILAAIVIVAYNGVTSSSRDASVKSDLQNLAKKLELYNAANGSYPASVGALDSMGLKLNQGLYAVNRNNIYYYRGEDTVSYAIGAIPTSGTAYHLVNGSIQSAGGVSAATTRSQVDVTGVDDDGDGTTDEVIGTSGHSWDGTTGTWATWTE